MDLQLKNKIILITGATGGIGRAIAEAFLNESAIVVSVHRNEERFAELKTEFQSKQIPVENLHGYKTDLLSNTAVQQTVTEIANQFQRIDVLVNCAGHSVEQPFALHTEEMIGEMIDINLKSPMFFSQAVLKPMFKQKDGCIINISSLVASRRGRGVVAYASAKAGLDTFTRALAQEVGRKNIRVNSICPGLIQTEMSAPLIERMGTQLEHETALNRPGTPEEVAQAVLFLASSKTASFITGTNLHVDGGLYL